MFSLIDKQKIFAESEREEASSCLHKLLFLHMTHLSMGFGISFTRACQILRFKVTYGKLCSWKSFSRHVEEKKNGKCL